MLKLTKRLQALLDLVPLDCVVADIGSDHAILPCALMQQKRCKHAYACDINEGPLQHAKETIAKYDLQQQVTPVLSDGLTNVPEDATVYVIAGMGFETIKMILEQNEDKIKKAKQMIVQCNRDVPALRKWISDHNCSILKETIVYEGHYYEMIVFAYGNKQELSEEECLFGPTLRQHQLFQKLWTFRLHKLENILLSLDPKNKKYEEFQKEIEMIKKAIC